MKRQFVDRTKDPKRDAASLQDRKVRLYGATGGPLMAWLLEEAGLRSMDMAQLAAELGVQAPYLSQLLNGARSTEHISHAFAHGCARFLGVPAIVVKLLAGRIVVADFLQPHVSEADFLRRALRRMAADPSLRERLPARLDTLPVEAQRALAMLYCEATSSDLLQAHRLPDILQYLQRAAIVHDESEALASSSLR